ncbi:MAG: S-layer family protein [Crocosphaera sp.]|nr:S-layer family protein [Crocosphaera sp.]
MVKFPFSLPSLCLYLATGITFFVSETHVLAQAIQADGTLPNNSVVNQMGNNYTITGGTTVGGNLFHSFSQFSVPNPGSANFGNAAAIANIISRVTGTSISDIQGTITANGTANLFLINPNGIIFGPNATIDIGGSFVASTADSIEFVGGGLFSARNSTASGTLLTMTAPLGLQMGPNPGSITVQGFGNNLATNPNNFEITRLPSFPNGPFDPVNRFAVNSGETLALVGGDIIFDGGNINALDGRIELGAFSNGLVEFSNQNGQIQLSPPTGAIGYNNINMRGASSVDVSGNLGGSVQVQGRNLSLTEGSVILANTTGGGVGGELKVTTTESIQVSGIGNTPPFGIPPNLFAQDVFSGLFANVSSSSTPSAQGGTIQLNTGRLIVSDGGQIGANTFGAGQAGSLTVNAQDILMSGASFLPFAQLTVPSGLFGAVAVNASGTGGSLTINTNTLQMSGGANINVGTFGSGDGGVAVINASNIYLSGISALTNLPTGIFGNVETGATGNGSNLLINTGNLTLSDGANIGVNTFSSGDAGSATINAYNIDLRGTSPITGSQTGIFGNVQPEATGNGGNLLINTGNLTLSGGANISVNTFTNGNAGSATINASNISLTGNAPNGNPTGILSNVETDATGNGGSLRINTGGLVITNGAQIGSLTLGSGNGGTIDIQANSIDIQGISNFRPSAIISEVGSVEDTDNDLTGNGGQININTNLLSLRDGGQINTSTTELGQAGNITVNAQKVQVIGGVPQTASGLFSAVLENAQGNGGNIRLNTQQLTVQEGGQIVVSTAGFGNGGNLDIVAQTTELSGETSFGASGLFANAINSTGNGGSVNITTGNLEIDNGATINVGNFPSRNTNVSPGQGAPGNINIEANNIVLDNSGTITADTLVGSNGNISIRTNGLTLGNNSLISTNAQGVGRGGNIELVTGSLDILSNSEITANASETSGGNINIQVTSPQTFTQNSGTISATGGEGNITIRSPLIFLRNGSLISTNGLGTEPGGNINITTNFLLSFPTENNDITANAQQSQGGRVIIDALGVFGIEFRDFLTRLSDITVTSELGPAFSGEVLIRVPEGDPTSGFNRLPENTIDPRDLIVIACAADEGNVFIRTGKGGIPDNPEQPLRWRNIWEDLRNLIEGDEQERTPHSPQSNRDKSLRSCTELEISKF